MGAFVSGGADEKTRNIMEVAPYLFWIPFLLLNVIAIPWRAQFVLMNNLYECLGMPDGIIEKKIAPFQVKPENKFQVLESTNCVFALFHKTLYGWGICLGILSAIAAGFGENVEYTQLCFESLEGDREQWVPMDSEWAKNMGNFVMFVVLPNAVFLTFTHSTMLYFRLKKKQQVGDVKMITLCFIAQMCYVWVGVCWYYQYWNHCDANGTMPLHCSAIFVAITIWWVIVIQVVRLLSLACTGNFPAFNNWYFATDPREDPFLPIAPCPQDDDEVVPLKAEQEEVDDGDKERVREVATSLTFSLEQLRLIAYTMFILVSYTGIVLTFMFAGKELDPLGLNLMSHTYGNSNICVFFDYPPSSYIEPFVWAVTVTFWVVAVFFVERRVAITYSGQERKGIHQGDPKHISSCAMSMTRIVAGFGIIAALGFSTIFAVGPQDAMPNSMILHSLPFVIFQLSIVAIECVVVWYGLKCGWDKLNYTPCQRNFFKFYICFLVLMTATHITFEVNALGKIMWTWDSSISFDENLPMYNGLWWDVRHETFKPIAAFVDITCDYLQSFGPAMLCFYWTFWHGDKLPLMTIKFSEWSVSFKIDEKPLKAAAEVSANEEVATDEAVLLES